MKRADNVRGGRRRLETLSAERRRGIASEAAVAAKIVRQGGPSKREIGKLYIEELRQRNPRLAEVVKAGIEAGPDAQERLEASLSPKEWGDVIRAYSAAGLRWLALRRGPADGGEPADGL